MTDLFVPKHPGDIALLLRDKRRHEAYTQAELAEVLATQQSTVSDWEHGQDPQLSNAMTWANALGYRIALVPFDAEVTL
jgi:transcriptional regulator with XRE-family HTH domain